MMGNKGQRTSQRLVVMLCIWAVFGTKMMCVNGTNINYKEALTKSLIFLEAQRSGKLPPNHRVPWRGDSGLHDGELAHVDLVGGYYDAGDNVKYGFPMAFTVTTLAWGAIAYEKELKAAGELDNALSAIRWGTDYFLKSASRRNQLFVQVGDPTKDHECWVRPENMQTPRTVSEINENVHGTEIAAETAAAMAASSIVFRNVDPNYSRQLIKKARMLFKYARSYLGTFDGACPFYCSSSGYNDELLWAAAWLYKATGQYAFLKYLRLEAISHDVSEFSWDNKNAGAQILIAKMMFEGIKGLEKYKAQADNFICNNLPESPNRQVYITPGGMIHLRDGANSQYVISAAFLFQAYADMLQEHNRNVQCGDKQFDSTHLAAFAKKQIDYILGDNPKGRSYMVGFGPNPPQQAHHRGASVPLYQARGSISCPLSFTKWYHRNKPNPNELTGAILGGPDNQDNFYDLRSKSSYTEPCTYINSVAVGILAKLAAIA